MINKSHRSNFKPQKAKNGNAIKKDFFKNKESKQIINVILNINVEKYRCEVVHDLKNLILPTRNECLHLFTNEARPITDIAFNSEEIILMCSRIDIRRVDEIKDRCQLLIVPNGKLKNDVELHVNKNIANIKRGIIHAKIMLFKQDGNYYIVQGSGNASVNARKECYNIYNDKEIYFIIEKCLKNLK